MRPPPAPPSFARVNARRRLLRWIGLAVLTLALISALTNLSSGWLALRYVSSTHPLTHFTLDGGVARLSQQLPSAPMRFSTPPNRTGILIARSLTPWPRWHWEPPRSRTLMFARELVLPLHFAPILLALLGGPLWFLNRHAVGRCRSCRYDLSGLAPDPTDNLITCPECGTRQPDSTRHTP